MKIGKGWIVIFFFMVSFSIEADAAVAKATLEGTQKNSVLTGTVEFEDSAAGLKVDAKIENASPGKHGFHIHEFSSCEDEGEKAGRHFNPNAAPHGYLPKDGLEKAHAGDFGNIEINENGSGELQLVIPGLVVHDDQYGVAGKAIILHEKQDNFSQPAGNAGKRIGCGVIVSA